jgi:hypothetical protein
MFAEEFKKRDFAMTSSSMTLYHVFFKNAFS